MNKRIRKKWLKKQGLYVNPNETWSLDITIAKFILPRLKLFKKLTNGYPGTGEMDTFEKWIKAIDKMIWSFEKILSEDNYYGIKICGNPNWKEEYNQIQSKIDEGLMLFTKWFQSLWW